MQYIPNEKERDEVTQIILKGFSECLAMDRIKSVTTKQDKGKLDIQLGKKGHIKFTKKEIDSMPEQFKHIFVIDNKIVSYRIIPGGYYQARLRRGEYNIEVAAKTYEQMKMKFMEKLIIQTQIGSSKKHNQSKRRLPLLKDFIEEWLQLKQQTIHKSTYDSYVALINGRILPNFGHLPVDEITRRHVQKFLLDLTEEGKNRTAEKSKQLMSAMFDIICEDYDIKSPMSRIVLPRYEPKKGKAFKKNEEKQIVDFCLAHKEFAATDAMLVLLYTGMRIGELASITYDDKYIYCTSEKIRKGKSPIIRKIPYSPMLKRIIGEIDLEKAKNTAKDTIRDTLKKVFPNRHAHEFRYTFITRAKECGVSGEVVMLLVGHEYDHDVATSRVDRGYTDYSEEFILKEIEKFNYEFE